jgi:hypothetical protein
MMNFILFYFFSAGSDVWKRKRIVAVSFPLLLCRHFSVMWNFFFWGHNGAMRKLVYPHHHHYCVCVYVYLGLCWYVQVIPQEDQVPWWSNNTLFFSPFWLWVKLTPIWKSLYRKYEWIHSYLFVFRPRTSCPVFALVLLVCLSVAIDAEREFIVLLCVVYYCGYQFWLLCTLPSLWHRIRTVQRHPGHWREPRAT